VTAPTIPCGVNGNQVRAKVIGEGGNLGVTCWVASSSNLGRLPLHHQTHWTNSAGVDCSDHEVNNQDPDRLAVSPRARSGPTTGPALLVSMTDEGGRLVLGRQQGIKTI